MEAADAIAGVDLQSVLEGVVQGDSEWVLVVVAMSAPCLDAHAVVGESEVVHPIVGRDPTDATEVVHQISHA